MQEEFSNTKLLLNVSPFQSALAHPPHSPVKLSSHWSYLYIGDVLTPQRGAGPKHLKTEAEFGVSLRWCQLIISEKTCFRVEGEPRLLTSQVTFRNDSQKKSYALLTSSQHRSVSGVSSSGAVDQMRIISRNPAKPYMQKIKY